MLAAGTTACSGIASGGAQLRFSRATTLPGIGVRLRLMEDAREVPLPAPRIYSFELTRNGDRRLVDWYAPRDLWIESQYAGTWVDPHGNTLVLATIRHPLPTAELPEHVSLEAYRQAAGMVSRSQAAWTREALSTWVSTFTGQTVLSAEPLKDLPSQLSHLVHFETADAARHLVYAFRFAGSDTAAASPTPSWFLVWLKLGRDTDADQAAKQLHRWFFTYLTPTARTAADGASPPSHVPSAVGPITEPRPADFQAGRDRVLASIRNLKSWWYAETPHYIFLSDLGTDQRALVGDLQNHIEPLRAAFEKTIAPRTAMNAVGVVRVFASSAEYLAYVDEQHRWTTGLWWAERKELVISHPAQSDGKRSGAEYLETTYHEAFHQYLYYALDRIQTSAWFNEGHAGFFGSAGIGLKRMTFGENGVLTKVIEAAIREGHVDLGVLLKMSYEDFYVSSMREDGEERQRHYALAWGLVYYLRKGVPLEHGSPFKGALDRYVETLWQTKHAGAATDAAFRQEDIPRLTGAFIDFWKSPRKRAAASRFDPLR